MEIRPRIYLRPLRLAMLFACVVGGVRVGLATTPATTPPSADQLEFFETRVRPVLVEHCYGCHSAGAGSKLKAGLRLDTRDGVRKGGDSGQHAVVPGDPERSRLVDAVRWTNPDLQMPPKQRLGEQQVADLVAWVKMGAPDPREADGATEKAPLGPAADAKDFWAFRKPVAQSIPEVKDAGWVRTPVDRFVLAKLEANGLRPSPEADRRTLIRRASFDLTGLPPSYEAVEAFVADPAPDAYEKLIDRLLASPAYGERWGRYWLDLARYADTKGYVYEGREDRRFVHAHVYRDWVIRAFNDDKPYDRFLLEQVAADQLEYPDTRARQQALPAMGFLTVGRRFLGVVPDIIDDRIDVLTRTTQGLTVACARCHDHKFDPIPTADYYALYGVFDASTERILPVELDPAPTPEYANYQAGLDERVKKLDDTVAAKCREVEARLRSQTPAYLAAVLEADKLPPDVFYEIRDASDVIPTVVRQWQGYLIRTGRGGNDPVFAPWHALAALPRQAFASEAPRALSQLTASASTPVNPLVIATLTAAKPASMKDAAAAYGRLFAEVDAAWAALVKAQPGATRLPADDREALRQVVYGPGTPARVPPGSIRDLEWFFDEPARVEVGKLQKEVEAWHIGAAGATPQAVVLEDRPGGRPLPRVFKRGNPSTPGEEVPRRYLSIVSGTDAPEPFKHGSGRLEMARAIASADNPLTARVMVNRIWMYHFGAGLVNTPSDFGVRSEPPSHPELLDWLALRFAHGGPAPSETSASLVESRSGSKGWSVKEMHRLIMRSAAYRQSSAAGANDRAATIDPENRLLWRMNRNRLDFESLRDSLLATTGGLDLTAGGRPAGLDSTRRSVYLMVDRQYLPGLFRVFDFASPDLHIPQRAATTIPQQALFFLNGKLVAGRARALANAAAVAGAPDDAERVRRMYRSLYQREPTPSQVSDALAFVRENAGPPEEASAPAPVVTAWRYGYGAYDSSSDRTSGFAPLPHYTGDAWQGGPNWPDPTLGWAQLTATGGHAGNDLAHAAVRRWVAPRDLTVRIAGTIAHDYDAGDGVAARIVSSRHGTLGHWQLHKSKAEAKVERLAVKQGDAIDFAVDVLGTLNSDMFTWAPVIEALDAEAGTKLPVKWNAKQEFGGPPPTPPEPMDAWALYAQVLLLGNEFVFVD